MSIYVPDNVAANPPILTLIHYCGGTASAVFGQAQGGGIVRAADQYGFIMVVPSSGRCWDVVSNKTRTRDGLGDSHAIRQMVKFAIDTRGGNAQRVYATGDSSGGMMTELLLALYPDVFKAGSAFAGMPAGCRASNESGTSGGYSGACAGGSVTHTAEEWGDIVRMFNPGYAGHRPRVQLFHGDADSTIRYANHTEAIKEWTNVLGLATSPSSTTSVTLGNHQASRQRWQNACGYTVLDAFTSMGGDHGPSDALFPAEYVIPFLGLDNTAPVDPEIAQCGTGNGGAGGAGGGGQSSGGAGGNGGMTAGAGGRGGFGDAGVGGSAAGGASGQTSGSGGIGPTGGSSSNAGRAGDGTAGSSGSLGMGGSGASGGTANVTGGNSGQSGAGGGAPIDDQDVGANDGAPSCGCKLIGTEPRDPASRNVPLLAIGALLAAWLRRRSVNVRFNHPGKVHARNLSGRPGH